MSYDITDFSIPGMLRCGRELRVAAQGVPSMEESATAIVRYLYESFVVDGERSPVLVRFYKTHPYGSLEPAQRQFADGLLGDLAPSPRLKCLTLLATYGDEPAWRDRRQSRRHQAIPLPSAEVVERAPMISALVKQMGMQIADLLQPVEGVVRFAPGKSYDIFHVEEALGSPYIPAQTDFVQRYGIRSVVGFGGRLRDGELFAVVLFSRVTVPRDSASRFRNLALDVKYSLFGFSGREVYATSGAVPARR